MRFVLVKQELVSTHAAHFAGGKHAFLCMAITLAARGHDVHVVCATTKAQLLVAAMTGGKPSCRLENLSAASSSQQQQGGNASTVVRWTDGTQQQQSGATSASGQTPATNTDAPGTSSRAAKVTYHAVIKDERSLAEWQGDVVQTVQSLAGSVSEASSAGRSCGASLNAATTGKQPVCDLSDLPPEKIGTIGAASCSSVWVVIDADDSQYLRVNKATAAKREPESPASAAPNPESSSLFESLVGWVPGRCIALVQNVHFLPFGPSGTSIRTKGLLQAWQQLHGVVCVSHFVKQYLQQWGCTQCDQLFKQPQWQQHHQEHQQQQHLMHLPQEGLAVDVHEPSQPSLDAAGTPTQVHLQPVCTSFPDVMVQQHVRLQVIPLSAWGCFGTGPFQEMGTAAATRLEVFLSQPEDPEHHSSSTHQVSNLLCDPRPQPQPQPQRTVPVIAVLKVTPEKGCSIVLELARQLPQYRFLLVAGDPQVPALFKELTNVKVIEPQTDIDVVLRQATLVLAPSLWLEAWGMVVTEAMLRGIPVVVSDAGALPEAGMGVCPVVHVEPVEIPVDPFTGAPDWSKRRYPQQKVGPWIEAISELLSSTTTYLGRSTRCRDSAMQLVEKGPCYVEDFESWLVHQGSRCELSTPFQPTGTTQQAAEPRLYMQSQT